MSQADEYLRHRDPGRAVTRQPQAQGAGAWADLRPAARWLQGKRPVLIGAIVLVAAQAAWRAQFLSHMYFYRQDFFNLDFAISSPFSWHYLTYVGTGHVMIGERALIWVLARISLYSWSLASGVTLLLLAAAGLAAFRVLRLLFGERPAILVPLAVYLLSPLGIAAIGWWTVALESIPLQLAMCMALSSHIHYVRTRRWWHLAAAWLWVIFGLLMFEKGLVVPVLLFGVTSAYLMGGRSWLSGAVLALRRYWKAWSIYAAALAAYAIVLPAALKTSTSKLFVPTAADAAHFSWGLLKGSLVPGAVGGPWRWLLLPGRAYALAAPPVELTWLAFVIAVAVVSASILRRRIAWRAWMIFASWVVLADMLPVIIARLNWYPVLLALDTRYVADAVPVLAICIGLAFLPIAGHPAADSPVNAHPVANATSRAHSRPSPASHTWRSATVGVLAVLFVGSLWSASSYQSLTTGQPAATYIANAQRAVAHAPKHLSVVDGPVPDQVKDSTNGTRAVIGPIRPGRLRWVEHPRGTIDGLRMFGLNGQLYPAWVVGASTGRPQAPNSCWPQQHGRIVLRFWHSPPALSTLVRIGYIGGSGTPGAVTVRYGTTVQALAVRPGLHSAFLPVAGSSPTLTVSGLGGSKMCIGDAEAGFAGPLRTSPKQP